MAIPRKKIAGKLETLNQRGRNLKKDFASAREWSRDRHSEFGDELLIDRIERREKELADQIRVVESDVRLLEDVLAGRFSIAQEAKWRECAHQIGLDIAALETQKRQLEDNLKRSARARELIG